MEFQTTANRVINRDGKTYTSNSKGIIIADNASMEELFTNL